MGAYRRAVRDWQTDEIWLRIWDALLTSALRCDARSDRSICRRRCAELPQFHNNSHWLTPLLSNWADTPTARLTTQWVLWIHQMWLWVTTNHPPQLKINIHSLKTSVLSKIPRIIAKNIIRAESSNHIERKGEIGMFFSWSRVAARPIRFQLKQHRSWSKENLHQEVR